MFAVSQVLPQTHQDCPGRAGTTRGTQHPRQSPATRRRRTRHAPARQTTVGPPEHTPPAQPWAGYGMLRVEVPDTLIAVVRIDTAGPYDKTPVLQEEKSEGEPGCRLVLN